MYATKLILCFVLLNLYFCAGDDDDKNTTSSEESSQDNLGPQFADEYQNNEEEFAQGLGKALGLSPEETQELQEIFVFLGRSIAYGVGSLAQGDSHVDVDRNSSQADKNGKIAAVIGHDIGQEIVDVPPLNALGNDEEEEAIPDINSRIAKEIAEFFGTTGDIGTAIQNNSTKDAVDAVVKYVNVTTND